MKNTLKTISSLFLFASLVLAGGTLNAGQSSVFAKVKNTLSRVFVSQATESAGTNYGAVISDGVDAFCLPITDANTNGEIPNQSSLPAPPVQVFVASPAEEGPSGCEEGRSWRESWSNRLRDYEEHSHPLDNDPDVEDGFMILEIAFEDGRFAGSVVEVRRSGDDGMTMLTARTGEAFYRFDPGLYDLTVIDAREQFYGRQQVSLVGDRYQRFRVVLNIPMPAKAEEAREVVPAPPPAPDLRDYPQADGRLCDQDRQPMGIQGTLTIQGVDHGHYSTADVQADGTFSLSGLRRGTYLLRFITDEFYAEQVIRIPYKLIFEGRRLFEVPAPRDVHIPNPGW